MLPGSASAQTSRCIFLHSEGKILVVMLMENHGFEDVLNCNTQKNHSIHNRPAALQGVAALRESEQ